MKSTYGITTLAYRWWYETINNEISSYSSVGKLGLQAQMFKTYLLSKAGGMIPTECKAFGYHELSRLIPASLVTWNINRSIEYFFLKIHKFKKNRYTNYFIFN